MNMAKEFESLLEGVFRYTLRPSKNNFADKQSINLHRFQLFRDSRPGNHEAPLETDLDPLHGKSRRHDKP